MNQSDLMLLLGWRNPTNDGPCFKILLTILRFSSNLPKIIPLLLRRSQKLRLELEASRGGRSFCCSRKRRNSQPAQASNTEVHTIPNSLQKKEKCCIHDQPPTCLSLRSGTIHCLPHSTRDVESRKKIAVFSTNIESHVMWVLIYIEKCTFWAVHLWLQF